MSRRFPRIAPRTRRRRPDPVAAFCLPPLRIGIYSDGVLTKVEEVADPRGKICQTFNEICNRVPGASYAIPLGPERKRKATPRRKAVSQ